AIPRSPPEAKIVSYEVIELGEMEFRGHHAHLLTRGSASGRGHPLLGNRETRVAPFALSRLRANGGVWRPSPNESPRPSARHLETHGRPNGGVGGPSPNVGRADWLRVA